MPLWDLDRRPPRVILYAIFISACLFIINSSFYFYSIKSIYYYKIDKFPIRLEVMDETSNIILFVSLFLFVDFIIFLFLFLNWKRFMLDSYKNLDEFNITSQDDHLIMYSFMAFGGIIIGLMAFSISLSKGLGLI